MDFLSSLTNPHFLTNGSCIDLSKDSSPDSSKRIQVGIEAALALQEITRGDWALLGTQQDLVLPAGSALAHAAFSQDKSKPLCGHPRPFTTPLARSLRAFGLTSCCDSCQPRPRPAPSSKLPTCCARSPPPPTSSDHRPGQRALRRAGHLHPCRRHPSQGPSGEASSVSWETEGSGRLACGP